MMTTLRQGRMDRAGNGESLATLLQRRACGDQRSRGKCGFDHQCAASQPADDAVAPREVLLGWRSTERKLGNQKALLRDLASKFLVSRRIAQVDTGAQNRDGRTLSLKPAAVRGRIDSEG